MELFPTRYVSKRHLATATQWHTGDTHPSVHALGANLSTPTGVTHYFQSGTTTSPISDGDWIIKYEDDREIVVANQIFEEDYRQVVPTLKEGGEHVDVLHYTIRSSSISIDRVEHKNG